MQVRALNRNNLIALLVHPGETRDRLGARRAHGSGLQFVCKEDEAQLDIPDRRRGAA